MTPLVLALLLAAAPADTLPARLYRRVEGTVGERAVRVAIRKEGESLSGWYETPGQPGAAWPDSAWLTGTIARDGAFEWKELSAAGWPVATLAGRLAAGPDGVVLTGTRRPKEGPDEPVRLAERRIALPNGALVPVDVVRGDSADGWWVYAEVPRAVAPGGGPADPALNAAIAATIDTLFRRFAADHEALEADPEEARWRQTYGPSWFEAGYDAWAGPGGLLAIEVVYHTYETGAAHPNTNLVSLVWDPAAGRALELADLFREGAEWPAAVSAAAVAALDPRLVDASDPGWIRDGAGPDPKNFTTWTPTEAGLRIVFDPYEVAAYAAGPQIVVIPWEDLAGLLDPAGPLAARAR